VRYCNRLGAVAPARPDRAIIGLNNAAWVTSVSFRPAIAEMLATITCRYALEQHEILLHSIVAGY
jgi:hypothetical protein